MEEKIAKLKEYLQMETEISLEEFKEYYSGIIESLNSGFNEMDHKQCLQARYICSIVKGNAEARAHRNKTNGKAFKKMAAKCSFWMEALDHRLHKEGLTQAAIDLAMTEIGKDV